MSYHVYFDFSEGLSGPLSVPKGTLQMILKHVAHVEEVFGLKATQYMDNPKHWESTEPTTEITDKVYCKEAINHNCWVRTLYDNFSKWSKNPVTDGDVITPEDAKSFWHALTMIAVPPDRWTKEYYRGRMEVLYEVMRGRDDEGISFDEKALTPRQAGAVIRLFETYLDPGDLRLEVPKNCDHLASSADGGYVWCEKCGAVTWEYAEGCRKRGCPIRKEFNIK